jgi:LacI family transcriptional regulator
MDGVTCSRGCQELNKMGFRSYFREHAPQFMLLEAKASLEDERYAGEVTRELLLSRPV